MQPDVFGKAIEDFYHIPADQKITVISPDFDDDCIPVKHLFRNYEEMPEIEKKALDLCKGRVLDVGCGAGSHSLYLQNYTGCEVTANDMSKVAIKVARKRGVINTIQQNFYDCSTGEFDTLLFLMNGAGIIGKLEHIDTFFLQVKKLLAPQGQLLLDSSDVSYLFQEEDGSFWIDAFQNYYGELKYQIAYKNLKSDWFDWLYIDFKTLQNAAITNGFYCEYVQEGTHCDYLARLTRIT
ncbi:class I SAM-dependent methyltransferase [Aquimarina sp. ERC-38]|uniref:class I SAM-dependent methyltransferase n=1 Tax=Aquimarina sp. ERC-38 TaxID=2949996 RepID=UPI0022472A8E|nr:class I SAM-dependent methyltransferase [Aquimarina sp. ERC-38]UZO79382.1 class I SAM-dependent methyltransferase [Aquimarina sp. ERC-38]